MFKTIFGKNFSIYIGITLISFLVLGTALSQLYKGYFIDKQEQTLLERSEKISNLFFEGAIVTHPYEMFKYQTMIDEEASNLAEYLDYNYLLIGRDFTIWNPTADMEERGLSTVNLENIPDLNKVMEGNIVSIEGTLAGLYTESKLTVCYPIGTQDFIIGAIFMSTSMSVINEQISDVARITFTVVIASCLFAFVLIYISSKSMTKPLQEMNEAAKIIASGDFEKRIEVYSADEIGQLAQSFNNMAGALEEQEMGRRQFIANISHDLRSPLTSIIGFLQAIKDGTIPTEKTDYYLGIVLDECKRLAKIANDLLDISKIQLTGEVELMIEEFELNKLIRSTIATLENRIRQKSLEFEVSFADEFNMVRGDYEKIQRVIQNLLDNAVKFTPSGGKIKIETTLKDKKVYISIKDSGAGLKEEEKQRIFERFYKADSSRGMDKSGSGIGLAIVKEFIKAHDEKISVHSEEGKGCEFVFSLSAVQSEKGKKAK